MATVNSVLGPLDTADFSFTLSHEHVMNSSAGIPQIYPEFIDRQGIIEGAQAALAEARAEGVRTIVDLSTIDLGRDIRLMEEVSRRSGVQVIAATGVWHDIPRHFRTTTPDILASLFTREIEEGIEGTGIKAGIIKVANDKGGVTEAGEIILRAAARTHKATRTPISTHTWAPERVGEQQVRIFEEEGVDLGRVYVGHSNDSADTDYLLGLLRKGVWLGLDRYPGRQPGTPQWEERTRVVASLIDAGYAHRIMLSHDWCVNTPEAFSYNPDGYLFITRRVLPYLKELGVPQEVVDQITIENPRRFFEGAGS